MKWVQFRSKSLRGSAYLESAEAVQAVCQTYGATFIINDQVEIAKALRADGIHLGQDDMPIFEARQVLGKDKIIGGTANTVEQVLNLLETSVDYIGLGPYRNTQTKVKLSPILGASGIQKVISAANSNIPIIAIGGIGLEDFSTVMNCGVQGLAISSAINFAENPKECATQFIEKLKFVNA